MLSVVVSALAVLVTTSPDCTLLKLTAPGGGSIFIGPHLPLPVDKARHVGEAVAMVVADTLERATAAANLIKVDADEKEPALTLEKGKRFEPGDDFAKTKYKRGNMASALRAATQGIRCTYTTPVEHHNPMEPSASTAVWDGDRLTVLLQRGPMSLYVAFTVGRG